MARIAPLAAEPGDHSPDLQALIDFVGYRPNALFTMAKRPGLLEAVLAMVGVSIRGKGRLPEDFRFLIAAETSRAAGCRYSAVHAAHAAAHAGMAVTKIAALSEHEASPLYTPAERAALRLAASGGRMPAGDPAGDFACAMNYYDEDELIEIVSVIALFGWFNRWNSLIGSDLEQEPGTFAERIACLQPDEFARKSES